MSKKKTFQRIIRHQEIHEEPHIQRVKLTKATQHTVMGQKSPKSISTVTENPCLLSIHLSNKRDAVNRQEENLSEHHLCTSTERLYWQFAN